MTETSGSRSDVHGQDGEVGHVPSLLRRVAQWMTADKRSDMARPTCPLCGAEVVGGVGSFGGVSGKRVHLEPERDELIAHCPVHGRPPFNRPVEQDGA
jgi:hypothetical protein